MGSVTIVAVTQAPAPAKAPKKFTRKLVELLDATLSPSTDAGDAGDAGDDAPTDAARQRRVRTLALDQHGSPLLQVRKQEHLGALTAAVSLTRRPSGQHPNVPDERARAFLRAGVTCYQSMLRVTAVHHPTLHQSILHHLLHDPPGSDAEDQQSGTVRAACPVPAPPPTFTDDAWERSSDGAAAAVSR